MIDMEGLNNLIGSYVGDMIDNMKETRLTKDQMLQLANNLKEDPQAKEFWTADLNDMLYWLNNSPLFTLPAIKVMDKPVNMTSHGIVTLTTRKIQTGYTPFDMYYQAIMDQLRCELNENNQFINREDLDLKYSTIYEDIYIHNSSPKGFYLYLYRNNRYLVRFATMAVNISGYFIIKG